MGCAKLLLCDLGIAFSPDGKYVYITETGGAQGFYGYDGAAAAGM